MQIQLNTDKHIEGTERLKSYVSQELNDSLKHLANHLTRVEVHLSDQNADKGGADDIQCKLEARIQGKQPVAVVSRNATEALALRDSIEKLKARLDTVVGKMRRH